LFDNMMPLTRFYDDEVILSQFHDIPLHRNFHPALKKVEVFMHGFVQMLERLYFIGGHDSQLDRLRTVIKNPSFFRSDFFLNFHVFNLAKLRITQIKKIIKDFFFFKDSSVSYFFVYFRVFRGLFLYTSFFYQQMQLLLLSSSQVFPL